MTKPELVKDFAAKYGYTQASIFDLYDQIREYIMDTLADGEEIVITGVFKLGTKQRAERVGRNPSTLEEYPIRAARVPVIKFGEALKAAVDKR